MNFQKYTEIHDDYAYNFYGDITYRTEMVAYAQMAKKFMNKPFNSPLDIVGNYDWHQNLPYEQYLFGEVEVPAMKDMKIIDFGCGPGRMVERVKKLCSEVDGVDISDYAITYAEENIKGSMFYVSSGVDVGNAPENHYDVVFSTICMQHIPCKTIRKNIFRGMYNLLKPGGNISIQVAYNPTMEAGVWSPDTEHADYDSDFWNAKATNGHADMIINQRTLNNFITDLSEIYENVTYDMFHVTDKYQNLGGAFHANYWASDWLFVKGYKNEITKTQ